MAYYSAKEIVMTIEYSIDGHKQKCKHERIPRDLGIWLGDLYYDLKQKGCELSRVVLKLNDTILEMVDEDDKGDSNG